MLAAFVFLLIVICAAAMLMATLLRGSGQWTAAFQKVAERYGGWFSPAGLFRKPAAAFTYQDYHCHLRCKSRHRASPGPQTELRVAWPIKQTRLEIIRDHGSTRIRGFRSLPELSFGDPEFEEQFATLCNDAKTAKTLLSSGLKWQVVQLASLPWSDSLYVGFDRGWLTVSKRSYIKHPDMLDDFVRLSLGVLDQALLTYSEGIDFADPHQASVVENVQCPVCSTDLTDHVVICLRCKTPHCLECWQYNGRCGMFACGETRCTQIASPSNR